MSGERLIGQAYIAILPDDTAFGTKTQGLVDRDLSAVRGQVPVSPELDKRALAQILATLKALRTDIQVGLGLSKPDLAKAAATLKTLGASPVNVRVGVDKGDLAKAAAELKLAAQNVDLKPSISTAQLAVMRETMNAYLRGDKVDVGAQIKAADLAIMRASMNTFFAGDKVDIGVAVSPAQLAAMKSAMNAYLSGDKVDVGVQVSKSQLAAMRESMNAYLGADKVDVGVAISPAQLALMRAVMQKYLGDQNVKIGLGLDPAKLAATKAAFKSAMATMVSPTALAAADSQFNTMDGRIAAITTHLRATGEVGTTSFNLMSKAVADVTDRIDMLHSTGIVNTQDVAQVRQLNADLNTLSTITGLTAANAAKNAAGLGTWAGWVNLLTAKIPLFGGALTALKFPNWLGQASGVHILLEAALELVAVWGPATIAMVGFGLLAASTVQSIKQQFTNMQAVVDATGASFKGLKGTLSSLQTAVQPKVMQLFGDYLTLSSNSASHFSTIMQGVGNVLDNFGAKLVMFLNSKTTFTFLHSAAGDIQGLGVAFSQVGRIIGSLITVLPGYAALLLKAGGAILTVAANTVSAIKPILGLGLALHGAIFYLGLATTAVLTLGRSFAAGAIAKGIGGIEAAFGSLAGTGAAAGIWAKNFTSDTTAVAEAAGNTGSKLSNFGTAVGGFVGTAVGGFAKFGSGVKTWVSDTAGMIKEFGLAETAGARFGAVMDLIPFGPVGLAAAGLAAVIGGVLYEATKHQTTAAEQLNAQMEKIISASNIINVQQNIASAIAATTKAISQEQQTMQKLTGSSTATAQSLTALGPSLTNPVTGGFSALGQKVAETTTNISQNSSAVKQYIDQNNTAGMRIANLTSQFGSAAAAAEVLTLAGVKQSDVATANAAAWALDEQKIQATAAAYGFMNQTGSAAAAQLATINISTGDATKALQTLTSAEQAWITLISGGDSAFVSFEQGFSNLSAAMGSAAAKAPTITVTTGQLKQTFSALGGTMAGTSAASLAVRQAFDSQLTSGVTLYGNLQQLAAASGNTTAAQTSLTKSGKDIIAQLLPFAAGSKEATAQVSSLAQIMGGPATDNFQVLAKWVGNTKGAMGDLNQQQNNLTLSAANLTTAEKNLGNALATTITQGQAAAIAKTANLTAATQNLATEASNTKDTLTSNAVVLSGEYVAALQKSGLDTKTAEQYLNAYLKQLGYSPAIIAQIDSQVGKSASSWAAYGKAVSSNAASAKNFANATSANKAALSQFSGVLGLNTTQFDALWASVLKTDSQLVNGQSVTQTAKQAFIDFAENGLHKSASEAENLWKTAAAQNLATLASKAATTKTQFEQMAMQGLGLSKTQADNLWSSLRNQYLDALANKAGTTKSGFEQLAMQGLGLTKTQADNLWTTLRMQYLDTLVSKGNSAKQSFINLAQQGLNLSQQGAQNLWNTLQKQYLDTVASKAGETKSAFEKVAAQFGISKKNADDLWSSLHQLAAGSPYNVNVNETLTGSGQLTAKVNANSVVIAASGANATNGSTIAASNTVAKAYGSLPHHARGGVLSGSGPAGRDSTLFMGAPGELVIPTSHAAKYTAMAKADGIPGLAVGGVLGNQAANASAAQQGVPTAQNGAVQATANAMATFASNLTNAINANLAKAGSAFTGVASANSMANLLVIAKYLMANGLNRAAAAGIAATVYGESGGNPESVGSGGFGLIGWTGNTIGLPAGYRGPTGNLQHDMAAQLPGIIGYMNARGGAGPLNAAGDPVSAGDVWSRYEAPATALSDTRPAIANQIYAELGGGSTASVKAAVATQANVLGKLAQTHHSAGNAYLNEPVVGLGQSSGSVYSFAENGPEAIVNQGQMNAMNQGMPPMTAYQGQDLLNLIQQMVMLMKQQPQAIGQAINKPVGLGATRAIAHG